MKIILKWQINTENLPINACAIDSVYDRLIVAVGKTIIIYDVTNGNELNRCEKHTQDVTCLAYRKDGLWFASGGKDNIVYLWDVSNLSRPTNKITFADSLIQISYNPCILSLVAISKTGLALYRETTSKGGTNKFNLSNTAVCLAWTSDGLRFAIGFENGCVSIRDKDNDKEFKNIPLSEFNQERIWCISFSSTRYRNKDYVLYVGTWDKNLYIYELLNYSVIDCKKLTYDPICIGLFKDDYFLIGSNNNEVNFFTKEGIHINTINEGITDWVLGLKPSNKYNSFVICTNNGKIINYQINFQIVHGIHNEKYVYRQNLMDIIIHNLITGYKSKIKCKKYIKKLAVYKDLVACMTYDKICIYQLNEEGTSKLPKFYIKWEGDLNLLLLASCHILICIDNRLLLYELTINNNSVPTREWTFDADIKYLRVLGGASRRESLIGGLKNGEIFLLYIDNQFPVILFHHDIPIRSLDINCNRNKLAIVDENNNLLVIDLITKNILIKDEKAKSVAYNSDIEDMISYWYDGNVSIKTSDFPSTSEKMNGIIVGFRGTKVFILQAGNNINVLDISHSATIMRYTEKKQFDESYKVACMGATNQEFLYLGFEALLNFDFRVAVNCFKKLQDIRLINLVIRIEQDKNEKLFSDEILKGDILSNTGEYSKAAEAYIKGGHPEKAIEMYSLLKMWSLAMDIKKKYPGKDIEITDSLLLNQADWLNENGKYVEAADLYLLLGKKRRAIEIYGEKGILDKLIDVCRSLNKEESSDLISLCGFYFRKHKHYQYATEAYLKLGDNKSLVMMNLELERWEEAFLLAQNNTKLLEHCYLQYAEYLVSKDKFNEAQQSYKKAARIDLSMKLLEKLIDNAVYEKRHKDACALFIQYSLDAIKIITDFNSSDKIEIAKVKNYKDAIELADIFNAYDIIYKYIEEPFSSDLITIDNSGLFNSCRFLVNKISSIKTNNKQIKGISPAYIFYTLAFLSKHFEAFKTARFSFEKLNRMQFPISWQSKVDFEIMSIRSKPFIDQDSNLPMCFRCLNTNPLINMKGDQCSVCLVPFIRSPVTQEILSLIEFKPVKGISDDEAISIIKSNDFSRAQRPLIEVNKSTQSKVDMMIINQEDNHHDIFEMRLIEWCEDKFRNEEYKIFEVDEQILKNLDEGDVFIVDLRYLCKSIPVRFYKNRMKDIMLSMCKFCFKFFRAEEYENLYLKFNHCPMCRNS